MSKTSTILLLVMGLSLLTACQPPKDHNRSNATGVHVQTVPNEKADEVFASAELSCPGNGNCPQGVALLLSRQAGPTVTDFNQCSAFLVGLDIVATNSHCIPEDLRATGARCSGRISVSFGLSRGVAPETYDCRHVISASEIVLDRSNRNYLSKSDYAFIRLSRAPLARRAFEFSRSGVSNGQALWVFAIDPTSTENKISGRLNIKPCRATQNSVLTPSFNHDFASVGSMSGCEIVQGNSGSAIMDANSRVVGIAYASVSSAENKPENFRGFEMPSRFNEAALFANAACIATPSILGLGDPHPRCSAAPISTAELIHSVASRVPTNADELFQDWKRTTAPRLFDYMLTKKEVGGIEYAFAEVKCMKPKAEWSDMLDNAESLRLKSIDRSHDVVMVMEAPIWSAKLKIGADYRLSGKYAQVDTITTRLQFEKDTLETESAIRVKAVGTGQNTRTTTSYNGRLPTCGVH